METSKENLSVNIRSLDSPNCYYKKYMENLYVDIRICFPGSQNSLFRQYMPFSVNASLYVWNVHLQLSL